MNGPGALVILNLADRPRDVPLIAHWFFTQWGHRIPGNSVEQTVQRVRGKLNRTCAPLFLVAVEAAQPLGVIALKLHERVESPDRVHWLGDLYVAPAARGRGVASRLISALTAEAQALGVAQLWLQTADQHALYARLGWRLVEWCAEGGHDVAVMVRKTACDDPAE